MNKLFIMLLLLCTVSFSYGQDTTQYVTNSDAEKLVDKYVDKAEELVMTISAALQIPAEHMYEVLIKEQVVRAWGLLILNICFLIVTIIMWIIWANCKKTRDNWWGVPVVITGVLFLAACGMSGQMLSGFLNPEYGAIQSIMEFIKV